MGANRHERAIITLLQEGGAVLVTEHPHRKYRLPDGRTFTCAFSPSDHRAAKNALKDLRKLLGIQRAPKSRQLSFRTQTIPKRPVRGARKKYDRLLEVDELGPTTAALPSLAEQLRKVLDTI